MRTSFWSACFSSAQILLGLSLMLLPTHAAFAQADGGLKLELNTLQQTNSGCRFVFMVDNKLGEDLTQLSLEVVLLNTEGVVSRLTVFDFEKTPSGHQRVRQFEVPESACDTYGSILINGASACQTATLPTTICDDKLELNSKSTVKISG